MGSTEHICGRKENGFKALEGNALTGYYKFADVDDEFFDYHSSLVDGTNLDLRLWDNLSLEIRNGQRSVMRRFQ